MKRSVFVLLSGLAALLATGCTLAPRYVRPASPVPDAWTAPTAGNDSLAAGGAPTPADVTLADFFPDSRLQQLVGMALANNRDLRLATLNVDRARELYHIRRNEMLPAIYAAGSGTRQHSPPAISMTGAEYTGGQYSVDFGVSAWEIDFFGRIRSLKNVALEQYLATAEARRAAQLLLVANVAQAYLTLAADRENLALAESTLVNQQSGFDIMQRRYDVGLGSDLDLNRARTQVDVARDAASQYRQLAARTRNALDLLAGAPVPDALLPDAWDSIALPRDVSAGLSSEVLLLRPDVMAAEHQLKAAYANIGAARASFFPRISLTSMIGTASNALSGLFKPGAGSWSFTGAAALPIFDARTVSAAKVSGTDRALAQAQYEKAIQTAFREVCDALAVQATVDEQLRARQSLLASTSATYQLATRRYESGIDGYLGALDAQRSLYAAQQGLIAIRLGRYVNLVNLYAILGGGDR
ncbi:MAG: efflux transporter outer membrane subunit [Candidatus Krumholzibacteriia bacterium]